MSNTASNTAKKDKRRCIRTADIKACVAKILGVPVCVIDSPSRTQDVVGARHIAMYLTRKMTWQSMPTIARNFGGKDHTTILHACRKIDVQIEKNPDFATFINLIEETILHETKRVSKEAQAALNAMPNVENMTESIAKTVANKIVQRLSDAKMDHRPDFQLGLRKTNPLPAIKEASVTYLPVKVANIPVAPERDACIRDIIKAVTDWENARFSRYERAPLDALLAAARRLKKASAVVPGTAQKQRRAQHV